MIETLQAATESASELSALIDVLSDLIPKAVMFCSVIAAMTPPPDPASRFYPFLNFFDRILNYVAFNFGRAKNKERE